MGVPFYKHPGDEGPVFLCHKCRLPVAVSSYVESTAFQGATGQAYLFNRTVNLVEGANQDRLMLTGLHKAREMSCKRCREVLGWKYEFAFQTDQKYKEGKTVLERALLLLDRSAALGSRRGADNVSVEMAESDTAESADLSESYDTD